MILETILIIGVLGLVFAGFNTVSLEKKPTGTDLMREISGHIREGAFAYLKKQYSILAVFGVIMAIILALFINPLTALAYVIGALCSITAGFLGMNSATKANVRTAQAATTRLQDALDVAFQSGSILSMTTAGLGLIGVTILYWLFSGTLNLPATETITIIAGFAFGASSVALFARVGGGIYTKAADVGADLVGKVEAGIPEDDPRNPATIADNVGDNVGDVAGMGADLFESYVGSLIAAMAIGVMVF